MLPTATHAAGVAAVTTVAGGATGIAALWVAATLGVAAALRVALVAAQPRRRCGSALPIHR